MRLYPALDRGRSPTRSNATFEKGYELLVRDAEEPCLLPLSQLFDMRYTAYTFFYIYRHPGPCESSIKQLGCFSV